MNTDGLSEITATEALALFKSRELSPLELMNHIIEQSSHTEPLVNALCDQYFENALTQARQAEKRYLRDSDTLSMLDGIPMAVKDDTSIPANGPQQARCSTAIILINTPTRPLNV